VFERSSNRFLFLEWLLKLRSVHIWVSSKIAYTKDPPGKAIRAIALLKNFGASPAEGVEVYYNTIVQGKEVGRYGLPMGREHGMVFPGNIRHLQADFNGVDLERFDAGSVDLVMRVNATYQWDQKIYKYCEDWYYVQSIKKFEGMGICHPNPNHTFP
jgi:hypothetical protein